MIVIIMKTKAKRCTHFSILKLIKILNQSVKPNENKIYPNYKNFQNFLNKLTFVRLISPKLTKLEAWNRDEKFCTFVEPNSSSLKSDRPCKMRWRNMIPAFLVHPFHVKLILYNVNYMIINITINNYILFKDLGHLFNRHNFMRHSMLLLLVARCGDLAISARKMT